jgi:hypothetical protein
MATLQVINRRSAAASCLLRVACCGGCTAEGIGRRLLQRCNAVLTMYATYEGLRSVLRDQ